MPRALLQDSVVFLRLCVGWLALQGFSQPLTNEALAVDDECTGPASARGTGRHCAVSALQLHGARARGAAGGAASAGAPCRDASVGDSCWKAVSWARHSGIYAHPEWYSGLTAASSEAEFQTAVHRSSPGQCPPPCTSGAHHSSAVYGASGAGPAPGVAVPEHSGLAGAFVTGGGSRGFGWTPTLHAAAAALEAPFEKGWPEPFGLSLESVATWIDKDLLAQSPFGKFGVLVPWPPRGDDQLGDGGWVGYSRRQVCYITAKSFLGATTPGYNSGLARLMAMCPRTGDFRQAFAMLLTACAADPTLKDGGQGPLLLVARADAAPSVETVREAAMDATMAGAGLRVCDYDTGAPPLAGVTPVPSAGCRPRTAGAPGRDFMTGGLAGQATQDISAAWFGGYLFDAHACGLGGGQDERLSVYFPEVTVLAYFLSSSHPFPQLRQPAWVLGARNFFTGLDGTARFDTPLQLGDVPLASDLVEVEVAGGSYQMSSSRPFLIFMSENQGFLGGDDSPGLPMARRNRSPLQRNVGHGKFAFEKQVRAWYRSVALTSYSPAVRPALRRLVSSIGAGPWLAGLWWGDSQAGLLAVWLGQAIAAPTWGQPLSLDYYVYSDFTENPGNQCFVHSAEACKACLKRCVSPPPPSRAYYLPGAAYLEGQACVTSAEDCGAKGLEHVLAAHGTSSAADLWADVERRLADGSVEQTIFDELLGA